jgi:hypothetical protein
VNLYGFVGNDGNNNIDLVGCVMTGRPPRATLYNFKVNSKEFNAFESFEVELDKIMCELVVTIFINLRFSNDFIFHNEKGEQVGDPKDKLEAQAVLKSQIQSGANRWNNRIRYICPCSSNCPEIRVVLKIDFDNGSTNLRATVGLGQNPSAVPNQTKFYENHTEGRNKFSLSDISSHEIGHYLGNPDEYNTISDVKYGSGTNIGSEYGPYPKEETYSGPNAKDEHGIPTEGIMNNPKALPTLSNYWRVLEKASERYPDLINRCKIKGTYYSAAYIVDGFRKKPRITCGICWSFRICDIAIFFISSLLL